MSDYIKSVFSSIVGIDMFTRVDDAHILDLYLGKDQMARNTLLLVSREEPLQIYSSQIITVQVGLRKDGKWALSFALSNEKYEDLFCHFCSDIIESSRLIKDNKQGAVYVCNRYIKWQEMLKKNSSGLLSFQEIKGLLGELCFLSHYMIPKYGANEAIDSWIGPDKADQDFVAPDKWYEVKALVSGAEVVRISSVEQLDTTDEGELILVYLDKTSYADPKKITLNAAIHTMDEELPSDEARKKLRDILLKQGYYFREEYDEYIFRYSEMRRFLVNSSFPSLRRKSIPEAITNANYSLSIADISEFYVED